MQISLGFYCRFNLFLQLREVVLIVKVIWNGPYLTALSCIIILRHSHSHTHSRVQCDHVLLITNEIAARLMCSTFSQLVAVFAFHFHFHGQFQLPDSRSSQFGVKPHMARGCCCQDTKIKCNGVIIEQFVSIYLLDPQVAGTPTSTPHSAPAAAHSCYSSSPLSGCLFMHFTWYTLPPLLCKFSLGLPSLSVSL